MNQKGFANIVLILIIVVLAGAAGYLYWTSKTAKPVEQGRTINTQLPQQTPSPQTNNTVTPPSQKPSDETANWETYTNSQYGFSFRYPSQVTVVEWQDAIMIQDTKSNFLSQVRVVKGIKTFHWSRIAEDYYFDKNNVVRDRINGDKQLDPAFTASGVPVYAFATGDAGSSFVEYGIVSFGKNEIVLLGLSSEGNSPEPILAQFAVFEPIVKKIVRTVSFQ